ncbi:hypothetical protein RSP822_17210 [Ralstonia solanacearum]|uniref:hypothetical protein n=1 Tax=Ralstonia solanacearum TaxID=305 RepID=UPI000E66B8BB|nr:hypothetical protein [Ralstonia solanacearum]RIJ85176.1 hypothetical protein RSP822_17210 [Ralstonia solanacearum]
MTYPTLERYQEALQFPNTAFRTDSELATCTVARDGFGLPAVMCGGFALTYTLTLAQKRKLALRCFHKVSKDLEHRYTAVASHLKKLNSQYFVQFNFVKSGIWVDGTTYPIVKMEWATGITLGEFVERHHEDSARLTRLIDALRRLAQYLESQGIAHGDIQPGNMMVSRDGASVQLIDYDGMFVPALTGMHSAEIGHRNFQHPKRDHTLFNARLDRFSFISLDLALRALRDAPHLWRETNSDADSFVFRANDYVSPQASAAFASLSRIGEYTRDVANFAAICGAGCESVPSLAEFILGRSIPSGPKYFAPKLGAKLARGRYLPVHTVIDASNFAAAFKELGEVVELVGKVMSVKADGRTRNGRPYAFVNFGNWRTGDSVRLTIWSQVLEKMQAKPQDSWEDDKWISIKGLLQKREEANGRITVQLVVSTPTQIHFISEEEAQYRLNSDRPDAIGGSPTVSTPVISNAKLLAGMERPPSATPKPIAPLPAQSPVKVSAAPAGANAQRLERMKAQQQSQPVITGGRAPHPSVPTRSSTTPLPPSKPASRPATPPSPPPIRVSPTPAPKYHQTPSKPVPSRQRVPGWVYVVVAVCLFALVALLRR